MRGLIPQLLIFTTAFLKIDFPRVPFAKDYKLFKNMSEHGNRLANLHLLKSRELDSPIARFQVEGNNRVEKTRYDDMALLDEIRKNIRQHSSILAERYGVSVVGIFGSYVRGEEKTGSDIDLLAEILKPISLLELVGAEIYLSEVLGLKVDLVPKRSLREELWESILRETVDV